MKSVMGRKNTVEKQHVTTTSKNEIMSRITNKNEIISELKKIPMKLPIASGSIHNDSSISYKTYLPLVTNHNGWMSCIALETLTLSQVAQMNVRRSQKES